MAFAFQGVMAMVMVQDIERALRFYRETLGFTVQEEQEEWVFFQEGVGLQLSPESAADVRFEANSVALALVVEDVEASFRALTEKGVAFFLPPKRDGEVAFASFRDTENNLLELIQFGGESA